MALSILEKINNAVNQVLRAGPLLQLCLKVLPSKSMHTLSIEHWLWLNRLCNMLGTQLFILIREVLMLDHEHKIVRFFSSSFSSKILLSTLSPEPHTMLDLVSTVHKKLSFGVIASSITSECYCLLKGKMA